MNTQPKDIKKEARTLKQRGLPDQSFFDVTFHDNTNRKEHDTNWSEFSTIKRVQCMGGTKTVMVSNHKVKNIKLSHAGLSVSVDVPDDCEVYQAIRAETLF